MSQRKVASLPLSKCELQQKIELYDIFSSHRLGSKVFNPENHQLREKAKEEIKPYYTPLNRFDKTLVFESRFESGNL